ncbi:hypothetical protein ACELLULO517_24135 [Acidisoma cellulosilytica]|uniref:Uncharacterized protein n=1 Tax=Acidisoma cellulosilyticum TaxID=2802395 RepID=A0A963Z6A5_9PROT|nr:hypothetical protein [Acidisoma cellulosilyticum]MCB8883359.1 hypothetical protein [Acidisoma cellulosilyticum]
MQGELKELFAIDLGAPELPPGVSTDLAAPVDGCRWGRSRHSRLSLPCPQQGIDLVLVLTVDPFCCAALPKQLLRVAVNGHTIRLAQFGVRSVIVCIVPQALTAGQDQLDIRFEHPNLIRPDMVSDSRDSEFHSVGFIGLGVATWRESTGAPPAAAPRPPAPMRDLPEVEALSDEQLMHYFASLGDNCEFGMAQRYANAEPLDLLRFAGLPPQNLAAGLANGFDDIGKLDELQFTVFVSGGRREYVLHQRRYEFQSHTSVDEGQMSSVRLLGRERKKLDVAARFLRSDLIDAQRIFVYKRNDVTRSDFALPLFQRLRDWGPNTLLHVVQGENGHAPGDVEVLADGFLRGYIDRFSTYDNAAAPPSPAWITLCRNSYRIWRQRGCFRHAD